MARGLRELGGAHAALRKHLEVGARLEQGGGDALGARERRVHQRRQLCVVNRVDVRAGGD